MWSSTFHFNVHLNYLDGRKGRVQKTINQDDGSQTLHLMVL
jgi:hypothetical protein